MERILCPDQLKTDATSPNAEKEYKHWKRTFNNFMDECQDNAPNKLRCLTRHVSSEIFEYNADVEAFDTAIAILDKIFIQKKYELFSRHLLATRKQQPSDSLDEFLQELHRLSKDCQLSAVSAQNYRQELVRDAFINGISFNSSKTARKSNSDSYTSIRSSSILRLCRENDQAYSTSHAVAAVKTSTIDTNSTSKLEETVAAAMNKKKKNCWFCDGSFHSRNQCPAQDAECNYCGKRGHFAKVCLSAAKEKNTKKINAIIANENKNNLCAITSAVPSCLKSSSVNVIINNCSLTGLLDIASSDFYINAKFVKELKLKIHESNQAITLASSTSTVIVTGYCLVDITRGKNEYTHLRLGVMEYLCADVILGLDFQKQHEAVTIKFTGSRPSIEVSNTDTLTTVCSLAKADVDYPSLFDNMQNNCIATIANQV